MTEEMVKLYEQMTPEARRLLRTQIDRSIHQSIIELKVELAKFWLLLGDEIRHYNHV